MRQHLKANRFTALWLQKRRSYDAVPLPRTRALLLESLEGRLFLSASMEYAVESAAIPLVTEVSGPFNNNRIAKDDATSPAAPAFASALLQSFHPAASLPLPAPLIQPARATEAVGDFEELQSLDNVGEDGLVPLDVGAVGFAYQPPRDGGCSCCLHQLQANTSTNLFTQDPVMASAVGNSTPVVSPRSPLTISEGQSVTLGNSTFTDADPSDNHTATVNWGNGSTSNAQITYGSSGSSNLTVRIDYTYDTNNFFNTPAKRAVLQYVADDIAKRFADTLDAITPSGGNSWSASFTHPGTGSVQQVSNPSILANEIVIYAGGRSLGSSTLGIGGPGGYSASGSNAWLTAVGTRGETGAALSTPTDIGLWGGSISFSTTSSWHFGDANTPPSNGQNDFLSVAYHEILHLFGFGTADSWDAKVSGGKFNGVNATAEYDGNGSPPVIGGHWIEGLLDDGDEVAMDPTVTVGSRKTPTALDIAAMYDMGWEKNTAGGANSLSASHTYTDNGTFSAVISVNDGTATGTGSFIVTVLNVAPTVNAGNDQSIATASAAVVNASFTDPGTIDTHAATINWGDGTTTTGTVNPTTRTVTGSHSYASPGTRTVTVTVTDDDGGVGTDTLLITTTGVVEVNSPPIINNQTFSIAEFSSNGAVVGTPAATDPNTNDLLAYSITAGNTGSTFAINSQTGQITVANNALLNFDTNKSFTLTVRVTDAGGLFDTAQVTINVLDVNAPPIVTPAIFTIPENSPAGSVVGIVIASDPDGSGPLTFAIIGGNTNGAFAIDAATGQITVANPAAMDFEANPIFNLTVRASDGQANGTAAIRINLTDVSEIAIAATDPTATEQNRTTATFTVSRSTVTASSVTVFYAVAGTATQGADYNTLSGFVVIPAGQASATIVITPIDDAIPEDDETVIITLSPDPSYTLDTNKEATAVILDNDPPTLSILATTPHAAEAGPSQSVFTVTRQGSSAQDLEVSYLVTGTATEGEDYVPLSGSVLIPAGQASASITVAPLDDEEIESTEYVIVTLLPTAGYTITTDADTVYIHDDDLPPEPRANLSVEFAESFLLPQVLVPGDKLSVSGLVMNTGEVAADRDVLVELYLLPEDRDERGENDTPLALTPIKSSSLGTGGVASWKASIAVPGNASPGAVKLVAIINGQGLVEDDLQDNVTTLDTVDLALMLGAVPGRDKPVKSLSFNGVTYSLTGPGMAEIIPGGEGEPDSLLITGDDAGRTSLTAKAAKGTTPRIGDIDVDGSAGTINLKGFTLLGDVNATGTLASLIVGDVPEGGTITVGGEDEPGKKAFNFTAGVVRDLSILADLPIASIKVADWLNTDEEADMIEAPSIIAVASNGGFHAFVTLYDDTAKTSLSKMTVKGVLSGAIQTVSSIGTITAGRLVNASILAGTDGGIDELPSSVEDFLEDSTAAIAKVTATGIKGDNGASFIASVIAAPNIGTVGLKTVEVQNDDTPFGIAAINGIKSFTRTGAAAVKNLTTPGDHFAEGDFLLRIV